MEILDCAKKTNSAKHMGPDMGAEKKHMAILEKDIDQTLIYFDYKNKSEVLIQFENKLRIWFHTLTPAPFSIVIKINRYY